MDRGKKFFVLQATLLLVLLTSCGPDLKTKRVSLDRSDELAANITDQWVAKDTELAVKDVLRQIEGHRGFQKYLARLGRKPKLFIADVQNQTAEAYFPVADLNDELLNEFSYSGDYILLDAAARDRILSEINYQRKGGTVDPKQVKRIGRASGADLLIFGDVRMKPETLKGKTVKDYTVNLRITDIESGEEVLRVRYRTSKYSERKGSSW
ncbi:MAG: penicillin-binding protein activator LpoB [Rickettsiales bacterium]|jgi:PBP1b-binding outer membrane lipoprotein LpoB|nr:penicillin-binding protein activator LpoB [Rickettsiales bacterium]